MVNVSTETQLRDAIFAANAGGDQTIVFTGNIVLTRSLPMINADATIVGNNATLDAGNHGRAFFVAGGTVGISNLTIANAVAEGGAGGSASAGGGGGGGGLGAGAAVFVNSGAVVTLTNVSIENAHAVGGAGGHGSATSSPGGGAGGGGLGGDGGAANGDGGGGGGYEGNGGEGTLGGGGGGGEFGQGGSGAGIVVGGGGGGGGQSGNGGKGGSNGVFAAGGGGGGATTNGNDASGASGGAGGQPQGGNGGNDSAVGHNGLTLGGGGGGGLSQTGGNGGTSGGGGGGGSEGGMGGVGGLGGGGGGSSIGQPGGAGGDFGGGGGTAALNGGNGGFGGGGGGAPTWQLGIGGNGGFGGGGGGGGNSQPHGLGGDYAGRGGSGPGAAGGGGAALGGAIFVRDGGTLLMSDVQFGGTFSVEAGTGFAPGQALGTIFFLHGNATTTLGVGAGETLTIDGKDAIAGTGALTKDGAGTLVLAGPNSYSGGTLLNGGTLLVTAAGAAGAFDVTFGAGGQTLAVAKAGFDASNSTFDNLIVGFDKSDAIDLAWLPFKAGMEAVYDAPTGRVLLAGAGVVSYTFNVDKPASIDFVLQSNGAGGTEIVLGEGVMITGTKGDDKIDAKNTVPGEPLPTNSADLIDARGGDDRVSALGGNDHLIGSKGDDVLNGGNGDDRIESGLGRNKLKGGKGEDVYVATIVGKGDTVAGGIVKSDAHVRILDFKIEKDQIELDAEIFASIGATLEDEEFSFGLEAKDDDDYLMYHAPTGRLLYDEDGEGGKDAIQFARLDKKLDLETDHFLMA